MDKILGESSRQSPVYLLTIKETIDALRLSRATLNRMEHSGVLRPVRIGRATRYRREDVEALARFGAAY